MPEVARKDGVDSVQSPHGTGVCCVDPEVHETDEGSSTVFAENIGVVRETDRMIPHTYPGPCCDIHAPPMVVCSANVYVENKRLARKGDLYVLAGSHEIITGAASIIDGSPQA